MGPLVLGTEFEPLLEVLRKNSIDGDRLTLDRSGKIPLKEIGTHLFFSEASPQTLTRIDVADERLRFGSLSVIGKRAHEIVGLFKVSRKETLWCSLENEGEKSDLIAKVNTTGQSRQLLGESRAIHISQSVVDHEKQFLGWSQNGWTESSRVLPVPKLAPNVSVHQHQLFFWRPGIAEWGRFR